MVLLFSMKEVNIKALNKSHKGEEGFVESEYGRVNCGG